MRIAFRVDASTAIGNGHIMRCLTLADGLRGRGATCIFVCRPHFGHLGQLIAGRGYEVFMLPPVQVGLCLQETNLGDFPSAAAIFDDAIATNRALEKFLPDWVVVDHYALGREWEELVRPCCRQLMVIDDLANRSHDCNLILDQNLGRDVADYENLIPNECAVIAGPKYALLRPEFAKFRQSASVRNSLKRILVFFSGSDPDNETAKAVRGVLGTNIGERLDVVIGVNNPNREDLLKIISRYPGKVWLHIQTERMAELMFEADLAIGGAGSASWERCCLRLPSIISTLADNQANIAKELDAVGAAVSLGDAKNLNCMSYADALSIIDEITLQQISDKAGQIIDGLGVGRVVDCMLETTSGGVI